MPTPTSASAWLQGVVPSRTNTNSGCCSLLYRGSYWYYELVEMARRVSLTAVVLFSDSTQAQLVIGMAAAFAAVCVHQVRLSPSLCGIVLDPTGTNQRVSPSPCCVLALCAQLLKPYRYYTDLVVQNVLVVQVFITMFGGAMVELHRPEVGTASYKVDSTTDEVERWVGDSILITFLLVMAVALVLLVREAQLDSQERKAQARWVSLVRRDRGVVAGRSSIPEGVPAETRAALDCRCFGCVITGCNARRSLNTSGAVLPAVWAHGRHCRWRGLCVLLR